MDGAGLRRRGRRGDTWRERVGAEAAVDASGAVRTCPVAAGMIFLGFGEEGPMDFGGGLFIDIEGARSIQMRCGFRPRDRDRTL